MLKTEAIVWGVEDRISARLPERPLRMLALAVFFATGGYCVITGLM